MLARPALLAVLLAPPAVGQMTFITRHSDVNAQSHRLLSREFTDAFDDFDREVLLDAPPAWARQLSRLRPESIFCSAEAGADDPDGLDGRGESILNAVFSLADACEWRLSGRAEAPAGLFRVLLVNADSRVAVFSDTISNAAARPIAAAGALDPGRYQLFVLAQTGAPSGLPRHASGEVAFTIVPAPGVLPLIALAITRRRRR